MVKKVNEWWEGLNKDEQFSYRKKLEEKAEAALAALELNWHKAKIIKVGKINMLIPYSEKLKDFYFFNAKGKNKYKKGRKVYS